MKKLQNFIVFVLTAMTGGLLPVTSAIAAGESTYFVPIVACRLFNTLALGKTQAQSGTSIPLVATKTRRIGTESKTMYDTLLQGLYINGGDLFIETQGGSTTYDDPPKNVCNIPSNAVAININLNILNPKGGNGWLRVWPYDGTLPADVDGAEATAMVWTDSKTSNAIPISITSSGQGFNFTVRAFFKVPINDDPANHSVHIFGDVVGYYVEFSP